MNIFSMDHEHPEWATAWEAMANHSSNKNMADKFTAACPFSGESWQYMGSYNKPTGNVHQFRHRRHPGVDGKRVLTRVFVRGGE